MQALAAASSPVGRPSGEAAVASCSCRAVQTSSLKQIDASPREGDNDATTTMTMTRTALKQHRVRASIIRRISCAGVDRVPSKPLANAWRSATANGRQATRCIPFRSREPWDLSHSHQQHTCTEHRTARRKLAKAVSDRLLHGSQSCPWHTITRPHAHRRGQQRQPAAHSSQSRPRRALPFLWLLAARAQTR